MGTFVGISVDPEPFLPLLAALGESATQPADLHLTLAHYGNTPLDYVMDTAENVASQLKAFPVTYGGAGRFSHVTWIHADSPKTALFKLRDRLVTELPESNVYFDFSPHITVANTRVDDSLFCDLPGVAEETVVDHVTVFSWKKGKPRRIVQQFLLQPAVTQKGLF